MSKEQPKLLELLDFVQTYGQGETLYFVTSHIYMNDKKLWVHFRKNRWEIGYFHNGRQVVKETVGDFPTLERYLIENFYDMTSLQTQILDKVSSIVFRSHSALSDIRALTDDGFVNSCIQSWYDFKEKLGAALDSILEGEHDGK